MLVASDQFKWILTMFFITNGPKLCTLYIWNCENAQHIGCRYDDCDPVVSKYKARSNKATWILQICFFPGIANCSAGVLMVTGLLLLNNISSRLTPPHVGNTTAMLIGREGHVVQFNAFSHRVGYWRCIWTISGRVWSHWATRRVHVTRWRCTNIWLMTPCSLLLRHNARVVVLLLRHNMLLIKSRVDCLSFHFPMRDIPVDVASVRWRHHVDLLPRVVGGWVTERGKSHHYFAPVLVQKLLFQKLFELGASILEPNLYLKELRTMILRCCKFSG